MSASVTLATFVRPEQEEPSDAGEQRRDDVQDDQDLPRRARRTAARRSGCRRSRTAGDRSRSVVRPSRITPRPGRRRARLYGTTPRTLLEPSVRSSGGTPAPVWTIASCQTLASPRTTRLMPRVMISGWTRKTPTPIPVSRPTRIAAIARATTIATGEALAVDERRHDEPGHRRDGADRQVDAAGQHRRGSGNRPGSRAGRPPQRSTPTQSARRCPGARARLTTTRIASRPSSGMIGRSRNRPPPRGPRVSHGRSLVGGRSCPRSAAAG